ncbi:MAG: TRZ/ATZ family hydrolase [Proteobacteria bacterium]|nr:TRZ/ATZ family hydrolase [Cystobacterineae bacterium]MCL2259535.1 TRZ/ATZ family hydrolase [Cystobacterineae bacterium]MCL2313990.1 TRZ/ATZ family hydrolase [Pseudomonadota bacterium]
MQKKVELLICPRWLLPIIPAGVILEGYALVVDGGHIVAVLPAREAREKFVARETEVLGTHLLMPGLVNLHCHAAMTLMRGIADDLPLMSWLGEHIWPAEAKHVSRRFVYDGTLMACAQMLAGGTTCFNDMYFFPEAVAEAARVLGMRVVLGLTVLEFSGAYAKNADEYLSKGLAAYKALQGAPRLSFCLSPHAPYSVSNRSFERLVVLARELQLPLHIHIHETREEIAQSLKEHGMRPLERLRRLGVLGTKLIAVHAVHLEPQEIAQLAAYGVSVAHCPTSNLKHGSGIAPLVSLLEAGVNVGLGTDGAASNSRFSLFEEMRLAALLAKGNAEKACVVNAHCALAMATMGGARALGLGDEIGSLEEGKGADLCAVDFGALGLSPCYNPVSHLVYATSGNEVSHVWVAGQPRLKNHQLIGVDTEALKALAEGWRREISL